MIFHLSKAIEFEKKGDYANAISCLSSALGDPDWLEHKHILIESISRITRLVCSASAFLFNHINIKAYYEGCRNPSSYATDVMGKPYPLLPIISFTTIHSRIHQALAVAEQLVKQTMKAHSINLYISNHPGLIDNGIPSSEKKLRNLVQLGVNIYYVLNIGPYRKQYPIIQQLFRANAPLRTPIVTFDDDIRYPDTILEELVGELEKTNAVIAHRGRRITISGNRIDSYSSFLTPFNSPSRLNMGTGKNGIAYRLSNFPHEPSYYVGPILAPTADDIWCKFVTTAMLVPTKILAPESAFSAKKDFRDISPHDKLGLYRQYNLHGKNDEAILSLINFFSAFGINLITILNK